ncbi:MAG TPA: DNA repair protein RadC [Vicinamibacterales bacterium]|nr:DNA repair protein RadC [Vicinamibacterales bacterium]
MNDVIAGDRPREKLRRRGAAVLGDNELLATLIGHGSARANALELANRLLIRSGGLHGLTRLSVDELAGTPGIGPAQASRIQAAIELGRRTLTRATVLRKQILSARDAAAVLLPEHGAHAIERFGVLLLDSRLRVIRAQEISTGTLDATMAHPREVFRPAIASGAAAVVLFHNHPSGDPTPTQEDLDLTRRMATAGEVLGIAVHDHLVLADARFVSIREFRGM